MRTWSKKRTKGRPKTENKWFILEPPTRGPRKEVSRNGGGELCGISTAAGASEH